LGKIEDTYALDMTPGGIPEVVHLSQYDSGVRDIKFLLYSGSRPYTPQTGSRVTIRGGKSDGTIYEYECTVSGNSVTLTPTTQMTAVKGIHEAEIRIYNGSDIIGSANIRIMVEQSPFPESFRASATEIPLVEGAHKAAYDSEEYKNAALNSQNAASASAAQAANSAAESSRSASAAAASETAAKTSETNASNSAKAAAASEKNAMSATPDGYASLASTFNALGLYVDSEGYTCQAIDEEAKD
jgi:hypothetical protein